jgi:GTP pyrophosphokinase
MSAQNQKRIARESMEIYAPIAHRLGIHWLKTELEDECFKYLNPGKYELVKGQVREKSAERKVYEQKVVQTLETQMREAGLGSEGKTLLVSGRTKGLYSIYTKMKRQGIEFDDVFDKVGFRIILDDVTSCYQALGIVHSYWKPAGTGKIKDYIALPKENGYRKFPTCPIRCQILRTHKNTTFLMHLGSLHTTVIGPKGKRIEIQIRTLEMHEIAESGVAAHWLYKQNNQGKNSKHGALQFAWMRELLAEVRRQNDPVEFIDSVKEDLFTKEVYVFSPKGELHALALGSSVLDFAYMIHSDLGNHCGGAKVSYCAHCCQSLGESLIFNIQPS